MDDLPWTNITELLHVRFSQYPLRKDRPKEFRGSQIYFTSSGRCPLRGIDGYRGLAPQLRTFVNEFTRQLGEAQSQLLVQHPARRPIFPDQKSVIPDAVADEIGLTVARWRPVECDEKQLSPENPTPATKRSYTGRCTHHGSKFACGCTLPVDCCNIRAFLEPYRATFSSSSPPMLNRGIFNVALLETLILHGEMDAVMSICRNSREEVSSLWTTGKATLAARYTGWDRLLRLAMKSYVVLNILYALMQNCNPARKWEWRNYRNTGLYQSLLLSCLRSGPQRYTSSMPHRDFFALGYKTTKHPDAPASDARYTPPVADTYLGKVTFEEFMSDCKELDGHRQNTAYFEELYEIMGATGLPGEIVNPIISHLQHSPWNMSGTDDPLAPENHARLKEHLDYCWTIIVRCFAAYKAADVRVLPSDELSLVLHELNLNRETMHYGYY